jgi:hypothetical protein
VERKARERAKGCVGIPGRVGLPATILSPARTTAQGDEDFSAALPDQDCTEGRDRILPSYENGVGSAMENLTPEGVRCLEDVAKRHGVSLEAAAALLGALAQSNGSQAQFNHPDLGGMGQWSQGGMIMVGDMFNQGLKHRVDTLCTELAGLLRSQPSLIVDAGTLHSQDQIGQDQIGKVSLFVSGSRATGQWWPAALGSPGSTGAQNDLRYAYFPGLQRLAILQHGRVREYDAGEHRISGFSQQQSGDQSLTFTSQFGVVRVADLRLVNSQDEHRESSSLPIAEPPQAKPTPASKAEAAGARSAPDDVLSLIERLAELRRKDILTEQEFATKKAELLGRL